MRETGKRPAITAGVNGGANCAPFVFINGYSFSLRISRHTAREDWAVCERCLGLRSAISCVAVPHDYYILRRTSVRHKLFDFGAAKPASPRNGEPPWRV